ncbi:MAG: hypothetical protein FWE37_00045 [Spirochaetaceae bacterium]|nr:hypothetical protein [Spirochaetaceae bacterium]
MKKFLLVFALMVVANTAFAQEEETSRLSIGGQIRTRAFISPDRIDSGFSHFPHLYVGFDFNEHVNAYLQLRLSQTHLTLAFIRYAYVQANVLGLAGIDGHSLYVTVGRTDTVTRDFGVLTNYNFGQYTNYGNGWTWNPNGGINFNLGLTFNLDPAIFPLYINWMSNLNMSAGVGAADADFTHGGVMFNDPQTDDEAIRRWVGLIDIGFAGLDLGAVALSANLYGIIRLDADIHDLTYNTTRAGASVGVTVNDLPVSLRVGANFEATLEYDIATGEDRNGFAVGAGVAVGVPNVLTSAVNFAALISEDDWLSAGTAVGVGALRDGTMIAGLDFKYIALGWLQPYVSVGALVGTTGDVDREWFDSDVNAPADRLAWELGIHFPIQNIPVGRVDVYMAWARGHLLTSGMNDLYGLTTGGLGGFALVVRASF